MASTLPSSITLNLDQRIFPSGLGMCRMESLWGSDCPENRQLLRAQLRSSLMEFGDDSPYSQILALDVLPHSDRFGISISHTQGMGGFLIHSLTKGVGLDIETPDRVRPEVLKRALSPATANSLFAPLLARPTLAWTALEASFKALSRIGAAQLLSDIAVSSWEPEGLTTARFQAVSIRHPEAPKAEGLTVQLNGFQVSTAAISP